MKPSPLRRLPHHDKSGIARQECTQLPGSVVPISVFLFPSILVGTINNTAPVTHISKDIFFFFFFWRFYFGLDCDKSVLLLIAGE